MEIGNDLVFNRSVFTLHCTTNTQGHANKQVQDRGLKSLLQSRSRVCSNVLLSLTNIKYYKIIITHVLLEFFFYIFS